MINKNIAFASYILGGLVSAIEIGWTYLLLDIISNYSIYKNKLNQNEAITIVFGVVVIFVRYICAPLIQRYSLLLLSKNLSAMISDEANQMLNNYKKVLYSKNPSSLQSEALYHPQVIYHQLLSPLQNLLIELIVAASLIGLVATKIGNPGVTFSSMAVLFVISIFIIKVFKSYQQIISRSVNASNSRLNEYLHELIGGMREILIYKTAKRVMEKIETEAINFSNKQALIAFNSSLPRVIIEGLLTVSLFYLFLVSSKDVLDFGMLTGLILLGYRLTQALGRIISSFNSFQLAKISMSRIDEMKNENEKLKPRKEINFVLSDENRIDLSEIRLKKPGNNSETLFSNVSHIFDSGHINVILGKSGSGKSSLIDVLMGLTEASSGNIKIFINKSESHGSMEGFFAYCGQYPYIFSGTVAENIGLGCTHGDYSTVLRNLIPISEMSESHYLSEAGRNISGGQRQRIGILRCIISGRPIMFFDEPTSSLDDINAARVICELERISISTSRLVVVVTHDMRFLGRKVKILNLDK